ncbi:MAG: SDR family oxidoreductase [Bacteroidota bacterium]
MKNFKDKVITITGAGSGIGRALTMEFANRGAQLALNDWSKEGLEETVSLLHAQGIEDVLSKSFDVSDEAAVYAFAEEVKQRFGNAHMIINNAGIAGSAEPVYHTPNSTYRRVMEINYFGVVYGTRAFLPQLVENNEGAVVNISSVMGFFGPPSNSDYAASKFAVRGFTEALSVEFHKSPISIHCVHPGGIDTNIASSTISDKDLDGFDSSILITPPEKLARKIIKGIMRKDPRIIYGNQSLQVWLGNKLLSKRVADWVIWNKLSKMMPLDGYRAFIKEL